MFTLDELTWIGQIAEKYDLIILADEAAQYYQYENPDPHIRIGDIFESILNNPFD